MGIEKQQKFAREVELYMNREEMLKNLHELDKCLTKPLEIHICGASAAVLKKTLDRTTEDVDLLSASFPIHEIEFRKLLDEIDEPSRDDESWLNDRAKFVLEELPKSYKYDIEFIEGENFNYLQPMVISTADLIVCKLAMESARLHDITDINSVLLGENDIKSFYRKLDDIAVENQSKAVIMEGHFKSYRPECVYTKYGKPFFNEHEIAEYTKNRYGMESDKLQLNMWKRDIAQGGSAKEKQRIIADIIGNIDERNGDRIRRGETRPAQKDKAYRIDCVLEKIQREYSLTLLPSTIDDIKTVAEKQNLAPNLIYDEIVKQIGSIGLKIDPLQTVDEKIIANRALNVAIGDMFNDFNIEKMCFRVQEMGKKKSSISNDFEQSKPPAESPSPLQITLEKFPKTTISMESLKVTPYIAAKMADLREELPGKEVKEIETAINIESI